MCSTRQSKSSTSIRSHSVVAVEGIHPDEIFKFEVTLCQEQFPEIENILPTSKSTGHNNHG
jgi:hypothetical protein